MKDEEEEEEEEERRGERKERARHCGIIIPDRKLLLS